MKLPIALACHTVIFAVISMLMSRGSFYLGSWLSPSTIHASRKCSELNCFSRLPPAFSAYRTTPLPLPYWPLYLHPRPVTVCFLKQQGWFHVSLGLIPLRGFSLGIIFKVLGCPLSPDVKAIFWQSSSFILLSHSLAPESWQEQCPLPQGLGLSFF